VKNLSKPNRESSLQVLNLGTFKLTFFAFLFHVINITHFVSTFYIAFNHYFTISISHYFHCLTFSIISLNSFLAISIILLFPLSHFPTQISLFLYLAISIIVLPLSHYFHSLTIFIVSLWTIRLSRHFHSIISPIHIISLMFCQFFDLEGLRENGKEEAVPEEGKLVSCSIHGKVFCNNNTSAQEFHHPRN